MEPLLDARAAALLERERALLHRTAALLDETGLADDARRAREAADALSEAFLVVIVGEFNAGKSSLVNALFGEKLMEEGPIPTTAKITLLRHGDERFERQLSAYLVERRVPSDVLRYITLVDTPGTNSIVEEHETLTKDFIPRADLVLFVTSYDRPLAASERTFLGYIRGAWGKRFACVVNKADLARTDDDLAQVLGHVRAGIEESLGIAPEVFPVSAALAYEAKTTVSEPVKAALWPRSRFEPFERFVRETLSGPERLALKLAAPLDAAEARLAALDAPLATRRTALASDEARLAALSAHLDATRSSLADAYARPLADVAALIDDTEARGVRFLEDAFRPTNLSLLRNRDRFKEEFNRTVIRDLDREIETRVTDGVDGLHTRALGLWSQALTGLREAAPAGDPDMPGGFDRGAALATLDREADRRLRLHDVREEARRLLEGAQGSADMAQYAGFGAIGVGVLGGLVVLTTTLDALGGFGIATAGLLGIASLTFLPARRRQAVDEFHGRMTTLRADLLRGLEEGFARLADTTIERTRATTKPFADAVAGARTTLDAVDAERGSVAAEARALRSEVAAAAPPPSAATA